MKQVFLDVETKTAFSAANDRDPGRLGVSFVGIYRRGGGEEGFGSFFETDLGKLWPILETAELVVGYNIKKFDWPALNPYYPGDLTRLPTLDLLEVVKSCLGRRLRLDNLARASLGTGKIGNGFDAIEYYRTGALDKLEEYCLKDVAVTRDLYDFGKKNGFWHYFEPLHEKRQFAIRWPEIEKKPVTNLTLGI